MGNYKTYKLFCAHVDESGNVEKDSLRELGTLEDIPEAPLIIKEQDEYKEKANYYKKVSDEFSKLSVKYANELNETRIQLKEIQEENKELKSDREKLRNRIIEINKEYDEDVAAYEAEMEELYLRIDSLDKENKELKKEIEVLKADNKDLEDCHESHCKLIGEWDDRCKELEKEVEVLKAGNEELAKKLIDTEHMRDQYRILYDKYQTLFSVTEEMALDLNKLLDDTYDLIGKATWVNALGFVRRIEECIAPKKDVIKEWSTTMDRERTYYDKQLEVAYRKSRESK